MAFTSLAIIAGITAVPSAAPTSAHGLGPETTCSAATITVVDGDTIRACGGTREARSDRRSGATGALQPWLQLHALVFALVGHSSFDAATILLATGVVNNRPDMPDDVHDAALAKGRLRYCPICDGYEALPTRRAAPSGTVVADCF
jgi:hypothetical protein